MNRSPPGSKRLNRLFPYTTIVRSEYAISTAAEQAGRGVAGAVVKVATRVEWSAALGQGALRDGIGLRVRPAPPLAESLVLTGFNYDSDVRRVQAAGLATLLPLVRDIRRLGSCALDLCHIAEGTADGYYEERSEEHTSELKSLMRISYAGFCLKNINYTA